MSKGQIFFYLLTIPVSDSIFFTYFQFIMGESSEWQNLFYLLSVYYEYESGELESESWAFESEFELWNIRTRLQLVDCQTPVLRECTVRCLKLFW